MILGNEWRQFTDFIVSHNNKNFEVLSHENGYLVSTWYDDDDLEELGEPVPKLYYSLRNGTTEYQSIEGFCEGFAEAVWSDDAVFYVL